MISRLGTLLCATICLWTVGMAQQSTASLADIQNVVIIYESKWSFDSLYGFFPDANGVANAGKAARQVDQNGRTFPTLPVPLDVKLQPDLRIPSNLPLAPFDLAKYMRPDEQTG